jgi:hypothetical protein
MCNLRLSLGAPISRVAYFAFPPGVSLKGLQIRSPEIPAPSVLRWSGPIARRRHRPLAFKRQALAHVHQDIVALHFYLITGYSRH